MQRIWLGVWCAHIFAVFLSAFFDTNLIYNNMKKLVFAAILAIAPLCVFSQKFGNVDVSEVIMLMPEYKAADDELQKLQAMYKEELEYMKKEYDKKYSDYEAQYESLSDDLRARREEELATSMQKINEYIQDCDIKYQNKRMELLNSVQEKAFKAIESVGLEGEFVCIFDVSGGAVPYVSTSLTTDVTDQVKAKLGIK